MQLWLITLCSIVFLLSCANTYIQAKRRAFILTCLGFTGILFCLSFLIAAISLPANKPFDNLNKNELIICHVTGIMLAIQTMALFSILFALSIELYVKFRIKSRAVRDSLILKSINVFLCCFQPTLFIIFNIILMLIKNVRIVDMIEDGGWCNVRIDGNRWGLLFVRAVPLWVISIPGSLISCAAIIPSLIMAVKTRLKDQESQSENSHPSTPVSESPPSDLPSTIQYSNKISNDAISRMALYCILYSSIGIPYSIYGIIKFFYYWNGDKKVDLKEIVFCNYLSVGIGMTTLTIIFIIFATNGSSIKQYKEACSWWRCNCFNPVYNFITRSGKKDRNITRSVGSNLEKESRESVSISIRTEENVTHSIEMQEGQLATFNSTSSKNKKKWSMFTETEKAKKVRQSTEDTTTDENSSTAPLSNKNLSISSSSYSSITAIATDSSEHSTSKNFDLSNKSATPTLGGLSPAPRRTTFSSSSRDYNDDRDEETLVKRSSSPQIRNNSIIPRQTASAPTSPISTRPNSDRYNRYMSPLRRPPSPMINNRSSISTSTTGFSQDTNTTFEEDYDGAEPFPSILKIGKTFKDERVWRSRSTYSFASRSRMSNNVSYNSNTNAWDRQSISELSSSPTTTVNDVNERNNSENEDNKEG